MKDEELKLALEALEKSIAITMANIDLRNKAITAIKQALAAPVQEFVCSTGLCHYKTAAQRQWVGLTDEEIAETDWHLSADREYEEWTLQEQLVVCGVKDFARAIEAKLKEKNTP